MKLFLVAVAASAVFYANCRAGEMRTWADRAGTYRTNAELISVEGGFATLKKDDGKTVRVPVEKLSDSDQEFIRASIEPTNTTTPNKKSHVDANVLDLKTFSELKQILEKNREASLSLSLLKGFIAADGIEAHERELAQQELPRWEELASKGAIRVGNKWVLPSEFNEMKEKEIRLIKEAHRLIDIKSDEAAKNKFLEASNANPQGVRADFYLGLLNVLVAKFPIDAEKHFHECAQRLAKEDDLLVGVRKDNYVAALNNLAVVDVRRRKYDEAISTWRKALEVAPATPELVQNLGLMSKLAESATFVRIGKAQRSGAENLYAKVTVQNNLARFDNNVGWLLIPYIDTLDGTVDESGDEEYVNFGWCSGFAVGTGYVLTSRYPLMDADRIVIHEGANIFNVPSGKVVAISQRSNLALLKIDELNGKAYPLSSKATKPAQDVTIPGYREPGFIGDTLQSRKATIIELPNVLRHVSTAEYKSLGHFSVATFDYRNMILHDAILSAGLEGAPLLNSRGAVVGVHLGNRPNFGGYASKYSLAEPSQYAISFLKPILSDLAIDNTDESAKLDIDSKAQREMVQNSLYQLAIQKRAPRLAWSHRIEELHRLQRQGDWTSYEDKTCMACNGRKILDCRNCSRGSIRHKERELKYKDPNTGNEVWGTKTVVEKCTVCGGTGHVSCTYCDANGNDKMFH